MFHERLRIIACGVAFFAVLSAQGATTSRLEVKLTRCEGVNKVHMVLNGNDSQWISLKSSGDCLWVSGDRDPTFSTTRSSISLRLGVGRSGCHRPGVDDKNELEPIALIDLACCPAKSSTVMIEVIDPPMAVSYLRVLDALADARSGARSKPTPCTEYGLFTKGLGSVEQVAEEEQVRLQLNVEKADPLRFGLRTDLLPGKLLMPDDVVYQLIDQRAKGIDGSAASLSPNAIEVDALKLRQIGLKKLKVTVK